ncbi:MAG: nuclease A inhibitor family protein [Coleofasciculus sp. G3-WIS-01]|uniref:nuclease A inhibitor family protein n=1 Tax=Coleofasciculus sp. G3-WIS-01 TaxID=3069528 RepID=UPI0032FCA09B
MNEIDQLKKSSEGLLWISEANYPFEVFTWDNTDILTPALVLERAGYPPDTPIEVQIIDQFFAPATTEEDWHNEAEKAQVKRYQALEQTLSDCLTDIQVYRLGSTTIDIYIAGKTPEGTVAGLSTKVVET